MYSPRPQKKPKRAGHGSLDDLLYLHKAGAPSQYDHIESLAQDTLDGKTFAQLLNKSFSRLDPSGSGLSEEYLGKLIMQPDSFSQDEYVMLLLLAKYFGTIANLCPDRNKRKAVITQMDKEVLCQFLLYGNMTLSELNRWCVLSQGTEPEVDIAPPPLSS